MIKVRISADALLDLNDGFRFYDAQELGLGEYFASCLKADIEGLKITGGIHRRVDLDYHRALSRVFPHAIHYTQEKDEVVVWAAADCRRDPDWIRRHLEA